MMRAHAPRDATLPLVEIFETIEGEGAAAGFPTVFVRLFGCPLRCAWCDTAYSYAPHRAEMTLTILEIVERVSAYRAARVCLTGGEPLMYKERSAALLQALAAIPRLVDIHVETSGAIDIDPFLSSVASDKVRYIVDYKLPASGESDRMHLPNLEYLRAQDELKFVIANAEDFEFACRVLETYRPRGTPLFSPVWGRMEPQELARRILDRGLSQVKLSLQIHKVIWRPDQRGV
ncbi:MAG: 7-carboxy-7-deazaguanine synthase QueE [Bacilli bacterium]